MDLPSLVISVAVFRREYEIGSRLEQRYRTQDLANGQQCAINVWSGPVPESCGSSTVHQLSHRLFRTRSCSSVTSLSVQVYWLARHVPPLELELVTRSWMKGMQRARFWDLCPYRDYNSFCPAIGRRYLDRNLMYFGSSAAKISRPAHMYARARISAVNCSS